MQRPPRSVPLGGLASRLLDAMAAPADPVAPSSIRRALAQALGGMGLLAISPIARALAKGDAAPPCVVPTPDGAHSVSVADHRGEIVYLDFWASWCPPCRESFPFMNDLQRELAGRGLAIIAVSVDKNVEDARRFLERLPPLFTIGLDPTWKCASAYLLPGMPTTYVIDRTGAVRSVHIGFRSGDKAAIRAELQQLLDERK